MYCNKQKSGNLLCLASFFTSFSFNIKQWDSYPCCHLMWVRSNKCSLFLVYHQTGSTARITDTNNTILDDNHQWWSFNIEQWTTGIPLTETLLTPINNKNLSHSLNKLNTCTSISPNSYGHSVNEPPHAQTPMTANAAQKITMVKKPHQFHHHSIWSGTRFWIVQLVYPQAELSQTTRTNNTNNTLYQ